MLEAENATEALKLATFSSPDLIVLDLALPDLHGAEVLERIRAWSNVPIIILSVAAGEDEKVRLLQAGADDYVVKPFGMAELLARSEAALRRYFKSATENPVVVAGPLSVDLVTRTVSLNNNLVRLTRKEYRLLHVLAMHVGLVVTHDQLLKDIWNGNQRDNIQYLRYPRAQASPEDRGRPQPATSPGDRVGCRLSPSEPSGRRAGGGTGELMLRPSPRRSFYVVVSWSGDACQDWSWEIRRKRRPMGIRLREAGFRSHRAAHEAGRIALEDLLNGLVIERASRSAL
ncbi:DNA-binding response OmpR family regulator [Bradyrhizobium sp. i1.4.4]